MSKRLVLISHPLPEGAALEDLRTLHPELDVVHMPFRLDPAANRAFATQPADSLHTWTKSFPAEFLEHLARAEVAYGLMYPVDLVQRAPKLRWLCNVLSGSDHLKPLGLAGSGITVTCSKGVSAIPIAEFVVTQLLVLFKRVPERLQNQREHQWRKLQFPNLQDCTVGVIGLGEIGTEVARYSKAMGMRVLATRRRPPEGALPPNVDGLYPIDQLHTMLAQCNAVVLATALTEDTSNLLGSAQFAAMKRGAFVVNISRGAVLDEAAFAQAVRSGQLGGGALDVFVEEPLPADSPLWDLPNVLISPHNTQGANDQPRKVYARFVDNLGRYMRGEPLQYQVDPVLGY
jgi:phosphoglycerate dehydrogenase-like enzyme